MDTWQMIKAERASLVDALATLADADWDSRHCVLVGQCGTSSAT